MELFILKSLDLIGTFAFAMFGAYIGLQKKLDLFGVVGCGFLTAVGGGTLRELLLGNTPFYFHQIEYVFFILLGVSSAILFFNQFKKIRKEMLFIDAVGLATFAFIGASKAHHSGTGFVGIVILATITAVGGGMLREIVLREIPKTFFTGFYATPALILGIFYYFLIDIITNPYIVYMLIAVIVALRLFALYYKINIWIPHKEKVRVKLK